MLGLSLVIATAGYIWFVKQNATRAYSCEWSAGLVINYMEANHNAWPRSWADLRTHYENAKGSPPSFADLQKFIEIDWNADPAALQEIAYGPWPEDAWEEVGVIRLKRGRSYWAGQEPNRRILVYLGGQNRFDAEQAK